MKSENTKNKKIRNEGKKNSFGDNIIIQLASGATTVRMDTKEALVSSATWGAFSFSTFAMMFSPMVKNGGVRQLGIQNNLLCIFWSSGQVKFFFCFVSLFLSSSCR